MKVEEFGPHPCHAWAGEGGGCHDHDPQAGENNGFKSFSIVIPNGNIYTFTVTVNITTLECGYKGCLFNTSDYVPDTMEDTHWWL